MLGTQHPPVHRMGLIACLTVRGNTVCPMAVTAHTLNHIAIDPVHALDGAVRHELDAGEVSPPVLEEQPFPQPLGRLAVRWVGPLVGGALVRAARMSS